MADPAARPPTTVVLASASPRRLALLRRLGVEPVVRPAAIDETPRPGEAPADLVERLARAKAGFVEADDEDLVVAADTVVVMGTRVLGKPRDADDASRMLAALSGRDHHVLTGLAVRRGGQTHTSVGSTRVTFRRLEPREIAWYLATGEPDDKAGAYGLQGAGAALVDGIDGSDTNVIGLPLGLLVTLGRRAGVDLLEPTPWP